MTTARAWDCTEARPSLGVYALGVIEPAERGPADAHLDGCRDCRDELAGLIGLPALLALVTRRQAARINAGGTASSPVSELPSGELPGAVPGLAETGRRRTGWRYLATAAGLAGGLRSAASTRTPVVLFSVNATVAYAQRPQCPAVEVLPDHIPAGVTCQLWAVRPDGTRTQAAAWTAARDEGRVWYAGSMPGTAGPVSRFEITAGGRVLLTITPA